MLAAEPTEFCSRAEPRASTVLFELLLQDFAQGPPDSPALAKALSRHLPDTLTHAVQVLAPHKVLPLLAHQAEQAGVLELFPEPARDRLLAVQREVRTLNTLLFVHAANVLRAAALRGERLLVIKGLLFADSYYPDFATRPMGDLDLVAAPGRAAQLHEVLEQVGFSRVLDHVAQEHAVAFANSQGVACDAHAYLECFPDADWESMTRLARLRCVQGVEVRALEPHAMLAHLLLHMHGHRRDLGFVMLWLLDVALVIRRHRTELELERVRAWIREPDVWALWLRVLGLLERHGAPLPPSFRSAGRGLPPLTLSAVLRARRTTPWGLPAPLGWLRLVAHRLALRDYEQRAEPDLSDLCLMPLDLISTRIAAHLGRFYGW